MILGCRDRQVAGAGGVHGVGIRLIRFGLVHLRVGGGVDDGVVAGDRRADGVEVGDIEVGAGQSGHVPAGEGLLEVLAEHAAGSGDEISGHGFLRFRRE